MGKRRGAEKLSDMRSAERNREMRVPRNSGGSGGGRRRIRQRNSKYRGGTEESPDAAAADGTAATAALGGSGSGEWPKIGSWASVGLTSVGLDGTEDAWA